MKLRKYIAPLVGLSALIWFIIRVVPKPTRTFYPCQRAAFPIATGFVIWLMTTLGVAATIRLGYQSITQKKSLKFRSFAAASILVFSFIVVNPLRQANAGFPNSMPEPAPSLKLLVNAEATSAEPVSSVGIVKAEKATAGSLTLADIEQMVAEAVDNAGGLEDLVSNGDVVVLKPNLVTNKEGATWTEVPAEVNGITTDWRIVRAISDMVRALNPDGKIYVIEGSAQQTDYMYDIMNYSPGTLPSVDEIYCLEDISGNWREHDAAELQEVLLPEGKNLYPDSKKPYDSPYYYLNKLYFDADVLISLPLVKNHESASVTGSIKNLSIGATPANIYGRASDNNNRGTIDHGSDIHKFLHDFYMCRPADLAIMDGLQGLEYGPLGITQGSQSYEATKKNMRLILASRDLVALDAIESLLVSYDPSKINYLSYLHNNDLGCADATLIDVVGVRVADERLSFKHTSATFPKFNDNIPPAFAVEAITVVDDNEMRITLRDLENIDKIELLFDEEKLPVIYIDEFEELIVDISGIVIDEATSLSIVGYNEYLSYSEQHFTNLLSGVHLNESRLPLNDRVRIYPTQVRSVLYLEGTGLDGPGIEGTVHLTAMNGQLVHSVFLPATASAELSLEHMDPGIYAVSLEQQGVNHYLGKIFKE